ncbi:MAG: SDR family NAD(P)-dependent oxidoreductase [Sphingomonadales bacterium]|nr:SDR family NAD(P)-dependent oxidoreductase [Sphingomonadales bacterium]
MIHAARAGADEAVRWDARVGLHQDAVAHHELTNPHLCLSVVVVDRDAQGAERTAATIRQQGGDARFHVADVTKSAEVQSYVKSALDAYGRIDCFFNNAGVEGRLAAIVDMDEAMFDQVLAVNVKGVFLGLRAVLPVMLAQKSGAVVNTASVAGLVGTPGMSAYVASKHAVIGLTKSAAGEAPATGCASMRCAPVRSTRA